MEKGCEASAVAGGDDDLKKRTEACAVEGGDDDLKKRTEACAMDKTKPSAMDNLERNEAVLNSAALVSRKRAAEAGSDKEKDQPEPVAAAGKSKKKKLVMKRFNEEACLKIMSTPPLRPPPEDSEYLTDRLRACYARLREIHAEYLRRQKDFMDQFEAKGYVDLLVLADDDDEEAEEVQN